MLAVASCRWALSRSQHASIVFNECGWTPDSNGRVYQDPTDPSSCSESLITRASLTSTAVPTTLLRRTRFTRTSAETCVARLPRNMQQSGTSRFVCIVWPCLRPGRAGAIVGVQQCTGVDAGVPPFGMNTRNSKETHAGELAHL